MPSGHCTRTAVVEELAVGFGLTVLVDGEDARWLRFFHWRLSGTAPKWYVRARVPTLGRTISMHRVLIDVPQGLVIDHINGDSLDNRKVNLRVCTQSENMRNRTRILGTILQERKSRLWVARIPHGVKLRTVGKFTTKEEAAVRHQQALRVELANRERLRVPDLMTRPGRKPKPWYRTAEKAWYARINGRQIKLVNGRENEDAAWVRFANLLAGLP